MTTPDEAAASLSEVAPSIPPEVTRETVIMREMAAISDSLKAHDGEVKDLKARYAQLQEDLLELWTLNGTRKRDVDGRLLYTSTNRFPRLKERPVEQGGGRYTNADVVRILKRIGRASQITPESVNFQTLRAILNEIREGKAPEQPELAEVVELDEQLVIKVGAPK